MSWICGSDNADEGPAIPILAGLNEGLTPPLPLCLFASLSTAVNGYHVSYPGGDDAKRTGRWAIAESLIFLSAGTNQTVQTSTTAAFF